MPIKNIFIVYFILFFIQFSNIYPQNDSLQSEKSLKHSIWKKDNTWHLWGNFTNLFVYKDSLYCTYNKTVNDSYLLVRRDSIDYYQWFPVYKSPILKVLNNKDSIEAWTTLGYAKTKNIVDWKIYPNPKNDLAWCAVNWNGFSVWGLEEFGRSGLIYINGDSLSFEEIKPSVDVFSLCVDEKNNLYAGLENNKVYVKSINAGWKIYRALPNDGSKIRLIKFLNGKEYIGTNKLYLDGNPIIDCMPSDIIFYNGLYFLSTFDKGMFISKDGVNFQSWNDDLENINVWSICIFKNRLYAATLSNIFWREIN